MLRKLFLNLLLVCVFSISAQAQPLRVAVAANAQFVIKVLQADFKKKTGIEAEIIAGSSGKLTAQIINGAPYDLFLSADMDYPGHIYKKGFSLTKPKVYALGSLILSGNLNLDLSWQRLLLSDKVKKIAIANPALAPYGQAAKESLRHYKLWDKLTPKIVYGESIAQVNTYISTGVVDIGFTSESFIYENAKNNKLKRIRIDNNVYETIRQGMVILSYSKKGNYAKAVKFYNYLSSAAAKEILKQNGYRVP